jgi:hypothetical protein
MEDDRRDFGRYASPHINNRIKRLKSEKRWIQSHPRPDAPVPA